MDYSIFLICICTIVLVGSMSCKDKEMSDCEGITLNKVLYMEKDGGEPADKYAIVYFMIFHDDFKNVYKSGRINYKLLEESEPVSHEVFLNKDFQNIDRRYSHYLFWDIEYDDMSNIRAIITYDNCECSIPKSQDFVLCKGYNKNIPCPQTKIDSLNGI